MPCTYETFGDEPNPETLKKIKEFEAVLCGILRVNEKILNKIDWNEVGVSRSRVEQWWNQHKIEDKKRVEHEERVARENKLRAEALALLTPEQIKILGIKS